MLPVGKLFFYCCLREVPAGILEESRAAGLWFVLPKGRERGSASLSHLGIPVPSQGHTFMKKRLQRTQHKDAAVTNL